jgi:hypothetical protein
MWNSEPVGSEFRSAACFISFNGYPVLMSFFLSEIRLDVNRTIAGKSTKHSQLDATTHLDTKTHLNGGQLADSKPHNVKPPSNKLATSSSASLSKQERKIDPRPVTATKHTTEMKNKAVSEYFDKPEIGSSCAAATRLPSFVEKLHAFANEKHKNYKVDSAKETAQEEEEEERQKLTELQVGFETAKVVLLNDIFGEDCDLTSREIEPEKSLPSTDVPSEFSYTTGIGEER